MDTTVLLASLAVMVLVWRWVAQKLGRGGKGWVLRHLAGYGAGFFSFFFIFVMAMEIGLIDQPAKSAPKTPDVATETASAVDASTVSAPAPIPEVVAAVVPAKRVATLDVTPQQFIDRLNANLRETSLPFRGKAKIENGVMQSMLSDHHAVVAYIDEASGNVREVMVISQGDGSAASGADVLLVGVAALAAAIPDAAMDDGLGKVTLEMIDEALESGESTSRVRNDTKLSVTWSEQIGLMFIASPVP